MNGDCNHAQIRTKIYPGVMATPRKRDTVTRGSRGITKHEER
jgi:hypothetical protein